jgi:histidyl-tRNA synthetase
MTKIQNLKGFRDFLPPEAAKRQWLKNRIVQVFQTWGYDPLETPTLEPLELFAGQIGEDEKLFFKFTDNGNRQVALRYDQTVPTCRVVGQYSNDLVFPFRRYQIQSAFRAENTQAGRYREFTQCDADIFGSTSPIADAEVIALGLTIFRELGFPKATAFINDRSLLKDIPYKAIVIIDKLDKIGPEAVKNQLAQAGFQPQMFDQVTQLSPSPELLQIFAYLDDLGFAGWYQFEPTLARSFSYSTGPIWEIKIPGFTAGSVLGGERFDKLVEKVSGKSIPATGFGLGFDRTLLAANQFGLIPPITTATQILVTIFSPDLFTPALKLSRFLREAGIATELYPDPNVKLDKQLKYAAQKAIPFATIIGPDELTTNSITLKNLTQKTQAKIDPAKITSYL